MSRKPEHVLAAEAGGKLYGRRAVWAAIRELARKNGPAGSEQGLFTKFDLRLAVPHVGSTIVHDYLTALVRAGIVAPGRKVRRVGTDGERLVRQYSLVRDTGVDAPRLRQDGTSLPPTGQQNMWIVMMIERCFTVDGLATCASTPETPVSPGAAESYVRHLHAAGYLIEQGGRYRLRPEMNTGGHAPMIQRTKVVYDPNLRRVMWLEGVAE